MKIHRPAVAVAACVAVLLAANVARGFSIRAVTFQPGSQVTTSDSLEMTVEIITPGQPPFLYAPTQVSSNGNSIHVDIYPNSGPLGAIGFYFETIALGTLPVGLYNYEVVLHPAYDVTWGVRTNRGIFSVVGGMPPPQLTLEEPADGQQFTPGQSIPLRAAIANDPGGPWTVQFFSGDQRVAQSIPNQTVWWTEAWGGTHVLTARATNTLGTTLISTSRTVQLGPGATQAVVSITVNGWRTAEPCLTCLVPASVFTIRRTEPTNLPLRVYLAIDGTATPGADYQPLPEVVEIPAGQREVHLNLLAMDNQLVEGPEIVRARIVRPVTVPTSYFIAYYGEEALAVIEDNEAGAPAWRLDIVAPTNGAHLRFPSRVELTAMAVYRSNEVYGPVEFFANGEFITRSQVTATTRPPIAGLPSVHTAYWTNPPIGAYTLSARTQLSYNFWVTSPPVNVTVDAPGLPVVSLETWPRENAQAPEYCPPNADCAYPSFIVRRTGPTDADLRVYLSYTGSATPGQDYPALPQSVVILAGSDATFLTLVPNDDTLIEGTETVVASFTPIPGPLYIEDPAHSSATIRIIDNDSPPPRPVVRIDTISPISEESSEPYRRIPFVGAFMISRSGSMSNALPVFVTYSGTATPSNDYAVLPWIVTIPAGSNSVILSVLPVIDHIPEGIETVVAQISNCPPEPLDIPCYDFAIDEAHGRATVFIRDDGVTQASLSITNPPDGARFEFGQTIPVQAIAIDLDGYISRVEFFDGEQKIGVSEIFFIQAPPPGTPIYHRFEWRGASSGPHVLTARAVRADSSAVISQPVHITVGPGGNQLPTVKLIQPTNGAQFPANTAIEIVAETRDPDGYVHTVEFFADGAKIGERSIVFIVPPPPGEPQTFTFVWREPTPGAHILTARAIDDAGGSASSAPVEIRVMETELLPIVTVFATDAFAVEPSTNAISVLNTATFRIRRFGPTNEPLTVRYSLSGTASNSVDYEMLPRSAVIPAGQFSVLVTVRPIADNIVEGIETVVLHIEERPEYRLGFRRRAVALISDTPWIHPPYAARCARVANSYVHLCFGAETGYIFRLEASADLLNWETICVTTATDGALHFAEDGDSPHRFYRITPEPAPMPDN